MRRVVITGLGMVSPLACGVEETWARLVAGQSGAGKITRFDASHLATRHRLRGAATATGRTGRSIPTTGCRRRTSARSTPSSSSRWRRRSRRCATPDWMPEDEADRLRTGVIIGSGIGGLATIAETTLILKEKGPRRVSPFFIPGSLINLGSGQVSIRYGFKGPNHSVVTACSTGAHAIGDGSRLIQHGDADVMMAGGAEAAICELGIAGFNACKALSTSFNDDAGAGEPALRPRPRRLRHGRGRGRRGARGAGARAGAGREDLCRGGRATGCRGTPITSPRRRRTATAASGRWRRR